MSGDTFYLMRRDIPVMCFDAPNYRVSGIKEIFEPDILPVGAGRNGLHFADWLSFRMIPASRIAFLRNLPGTGILDSSELVFLNHGLSLLNQYWIKHEDEDLLWSEINLFENDFSEEVGLALVNRLKLTADDIKLRYGVSPEGLSPGDQPKRWSIDKDGNRILIKTDRSGELAVNELLASMLAQKIGLPHTDYKLGKDNDQMASFGKCFTSSNTEIVHALDLFNEYGFPDTSYKTEDYYNYTAKLFSDMGVQGVQEYLDKMLCIDYVMCQKDRHYNNFGLLHNIDTDTWSMAPLYDSGDACYANVAAKFIDLNADVIGKPFGPSGLVNLNDQMRNVKTGIYISDDIIESILPEYKNLLNEIGMSEDKQKLLIESLHLRTVRMMECIGINSK